MLFKYIFFIFLPFTIFSQEQIKGIIVDENDKPLENVTIKLVEKNFYTVTDTTGTFSFTKIPNGEYTLEVNRLGFQKATVNTKTENTTLLIHLYTVPIEGTGIIVTGTHYNSKLDELYEHSTLSGKKLQKDLGQTLAATLKNETGLAIRSMGPAPARPVLRGLSGDRVTISEDGNKTNDLSASSPDHAVTVEPFTVERIEVVRGPKVLLQTSTTIGGTVNIIRNEIPDILPARITGTVGGSGESANKGYLGSTTLTLPLTIVAPITLRGEVSRRVAENISTPIGVLKNSSMDNLNFSGGGSYIGSWGYAGISGRYFGTDYGIPGGFVGAHPKGVNISLFKQQLNSKFHYHFSDDDFNNLEIEANKTYYRHQEFENSGTVGAEFAVTTHSFSTTFNHNNFGIFNGGTIGVSLDMRDFVVGGFVFTPATVSTSFATFFYETLHWENFDIQFALRYNYDNVIPEKEKPNAKIGSIRERIFHTFSLSTSLLREITPTLFVGANVSKSSRVPTIEELFSEGPHLAAYSYETGNPNLQAEWGIGTEIFSYYKTPEFYGMLTVFYNTLPYYIISRNSGEINYATLLPIYKATGIPAILYGIENQLTWYISSRFTLSSSLSYTVGKITSTHSPLPAIPPLKELIDVKYSYENFSAGISTEIAASQNNIDTFEESTKGYAIAGGYVQYVFNGESILHNITLSIDNIFDTEYRNHLSRLKSIMPEAGRNFRMMYRMFF